jgi:hypothetical protein
MRMLKLFSSLRAQYQLSIVIYDEPVLTINWTILKKLKTELRRHFMIFVSITVLILH